MDRWTAPDPIFPLSSPNAYEAYNNSPTNFVDPSGLEDIFGSNSYQQLQVPPPFETTPPAFNSLDFYNSWSNSAAGQQANGALANELGGLEQQNTIVSPFGPLNVGPTAGAGLKWIENSVGKFGMGEYNIETQQQKEASTCDILQIPQLSPLPGAGGSGGIKLLPNLAITPKAVQPGVAAQFHIDDYLNLSLGVSDSIFKNGYNGWAESATFALQPPGEPWSLSLNLSETTNNKGATTDQGGIIFNWTPGQGQSKH